MSTDTTGGGQSGPRRITVEDILDGLIARTSRALQPDPGGVVSSDEVKAQAQQVVDLAQQLKDAVGKIRQLDPTLLTENRTPVVAQS
ncbi:MAG TPA: hypothetical protein VKV73_09740 [Chloroflexota bacterium]|nr:hypothetical protein [Chloroflexota bacterium]